MKGISDFISTVLIIAVTITVGIALFNWIEPLSREQAERVGDDSTNRIKCQAGSLRITNGILNTTSAKLSVVGENTGNINLDTFEFNIVLTNGTNVNTVATPAVTLKPANKQTFTTTDAVASATSSISKVRLISKCNSAITIHDDLDGNTFSTTT